MLVYVHTHRGSPVLSLSEMVGSWAFYEEGREGGREKRMRKGQEGGSRGEAEIGGDKKLCEKL